MTTKEEFNLSEKERFIISYGKYYRMENVKEFIEKIKEGLGNLIYKDKTTSQYNDDVIDLIDKLAGEKLT